MVPLPSYILALLVANELKLKEMARLWTQIVSMERIKVSDSYIGSN